MERIDEKRYPCTNTVYPTACCGPHWMCAKHHADAMKVLGSPCDSVTVRTVTSDCGYLPPVEQRQGEGK